MTRCGVRRRLLRPPGGLTLPPRAEADRRSRSPLVASTGACCRGHVLAARLSGHPFGPVGAENVAPRARSSCGQLWSRPAQIGRTAVQLGGRRPDPQTVILPLDGTLLRARPRELRPVAGRSVDKPCRAVCPGAPYDRRPVGRRDLLVRALDPRLVAARLDGRALQLSGHDRCRDAAEVLERRTWLAVQWATRTQRVASA